MAQGEAAGLGAALSIRSNRPGDVHSVDVGHLRAELKKQGAILDGTH
jgi:hypothetical protein